MGVVCHHNCVANGLTTHDVHSVAGSVIRAYAVCLTFFWSSVLCCSHCVVCVSVCVPVCVRACAVTTESMKWNPLEGQEDRVRPKKVVGKCQKIDTADPLFPVVFHGYLFKYVILKCRCQISDQFMMTSSLPRCGQGRWVWPELEEILQ